MRKILAIILSFSITLSSGIIIYAEDVSQEYDTIEYIVRYNSQVVISNTETKTRTIETTESIAENVFEGNLNNVQNIEIIDELHDSDNDYITQLISISSVNQDETILELNSIPCVVYAEPNYKIKKTNNDPGYINQWALNGTSQYGINIDQAWSITQGNSDVIVAVIDTGVDITHEDLCSNIYENTNETLNNQDDDGNGYVDDVHGWDFTTYQDSINNGDNSVYDGTIINNENVDAHGTHVSGIIAAAKNDIGVQGVASNVTILPIKVLSENDGTVFSAIKAIEYAEMMGARIANCSWGAEEYSHFLYDSMNNSDMLFVCSAGNDSLDCSQYPIYPASYELDNVLSVGATEQNGEMADFSNYGSNVDVAAPGAEIYSTLPDNTYGNMDGTSMSAPFVSGTAALLLSQSPELNAYELKNRILETATEVSSLNLKIASSGILNTGNCLLTSVSPLNLLKGNYGAEIIIVDNLIYSVGGYDGTNFLNSIDVFSPSSNTWHNITNMPVPVADAAVAAIDNKIIVVGGINNSPVNSVQIYDISTNSWLIGNEIPKALYGSAYIQKDNLLYLFGGIGTNGYSNTVFEYNLSEGTWDTKTSMSFENAYASVEMVNNSIYLIGGVNSSGALDEIYTYDSLKDEFEYISKLMVNRKDFSTAAVDDKIYIFGGSNSYSIQEINNIYKHNDAKGTYIESILDSVEVFDTKTKICSVVDKLDFAAMGMCAFNYFGNVYLLGGWTGIYNNSVFKYFGASIPRNIRFKTDENILKIKWSPVSNATSYRIETDGTEYNTTNTYYETVADDTEHIVRIKAISDDTESLWSEYSYYYKNSTLLDAKIISTNSYSTDKLYETGQEKWYKLDNNEAGTIAITLSNIPENCNYIVQLCDASGNVIATGTEEDNNYIINNVVLSPYAYYVRVSSLYGGDIDNSYALNCSFTTSNEEQLPDRVKNAFLKPSSLGDLSSKDTTFVDLGEYNGEGTPPINVKTVENDKTNSLKSNSFAGSAESKNDVVYEDEAKGFDSVSTLNLYDSDVISGSMSTEGTTITQGVSVPANSFAADEKMKVVVAIVPENETDIFSLRWTGSNIDSDSFLWHYHDDNEYYLTAVLPCLSISKTYWYEITYDYKSLDSAGNYTIYTYLIIDSILNEDFKSTCVNDSPTMCELTSVSINSSKTYTGKLDHMYDWDFYGISAAANQKISAYLISPSGHWYSVDILDHTGNSTQVTSSQYLDGHLGDYGEAYASIETTTRRNYMILVRPYIDGVTADETYTLKIFLYNMSALGNLELNDCTEQADEMINSFTGSYLGRTSNLANPIIFCIDSPVDIDYYAIDMSAGDKLSIQMDLPSNYDDSIYKYRIGVQDAQYIYTYNNPDSSHSKFVTFVAQTTGRHYISVRSEGNQYLYTMKGKLNITKTTSADMDIYETITESLPLYGECFATNDFIFTTVFGLLDVEFGIYGTSDVSNPITANLDNELDVDWYTFTNGAQAKTSVINLNVLDELSSSIGIVVLDSKYNLLSSGATENVYTFAAYEKYYIGVYVNDNSYSSLINNNIYELSVNLRDLRSDLVFKPLTWGTFIYDNSPEYLTEDDLADYNLGNVFLISAENLTGVIDIQSSHSVKKYMLEQGNISFDILLYNPTDEVITVELLQYGAQAPYETNDYQFNATSSAWAALQGWADYLQIDLKKGSNQYNGVLKYYKDAEVSQKQEYKNYYCQNRIETLNSKGYYVIEPRKAVWLLESSRLTLTNSDKWSPMNLMARIKTSDTVTVSIAAFRDINNVYSPLNPQLIYDFNTQRVYPNNILDTEKEKDVDGKSKGIATTVAEVEAMTHWIIDDNTTYFTPTVYNMANPHGYTIAEGYNAKYWITNFNPNADSSGVNSGVESDIIPLEFIDSNKIWYFDTRHYTPMNGNGVISGIPPIETAVIMGNYGVTTRYYVDITNTSLSDKTITYYLGTQSHAIIRYKLESETLWNTVVKCYTPNDAWYQMNDMFYVTIPANSTETLIFEVILPNADSGGFKNQLKID